MDTNTQVFPDETFLAEQLAAKLKALDGITATAAIADLDLSVSVIDKSARATGAGMSAIEKGIENIIRAELPLVIRSLIAEKRAEVSEARKELLDYQFTASRGFTTGPAPTTDTPLAMHDAEATGPAPGEPGSPFPPPPAEPELEAGQVSDFRLIEPHAPEVTVYDKTDADSEAAWIKF